MKKHAETPIYKSIIFDKKSIPNTAKQPLIARRAICLFVWKSSLDQLAVEEMVPEHLKLRTSERLLGVKSLTTTRSLIFNIQIFVI